MYTRFFTQVALMSLLLVTAACADDTPRVQIQDSTNFQADGQLSQTRHLPLMLVFSAADCSYCKLLEEDFIKPMLISGDYTHKVLIRRVMIDAGGDVRDFDGKSISIDDFALRYKAFVTPTVVFVDAQGHQLAHRLVGIANPYFYGGDLDRAIDESLARIHGQKTLSKL